MSLTNFDDDQFEPGSFPEDTPPEPEKRGGNHTFLIVITILGVIFLLALLLLLVVAPRYLANQRAQQQEQAAQINAANTATALAATSMANQQVTQAARTSIARTPTVGPTKTPVVVIASNTPAAGGSGLTAAELATVAALQTQMAAGGTATATQLPNSGFADDFGLPMMAGIAVILVLVIFLSRRLRLSSR
jgi:Na+-transporting methylmalonyl-CoA/oxaloacetate decarboxylase gamma subunit